jgi:PBSX family phage portal protein
MSSRADERLKNHNIRKADRAVALGITGESSAVRQNMSVVTAVNKIQLTKEEEALMRSMALTVEDNPWQRIQFTNKFNSLAPTYDPTSLQLISYTNNTLRQCIAAMISNIELTGYDIKRKDGGKIALVVSEDSPDPVPPPPPPKIPTPDPLAAPGTPPPLPEPPPPDEVPDVGQPFPAAEGSEPIMVDPPDVAKIKAFWDEPYPGISFKTMRKKLRDDLETTGNAYLEVIRDQKGNVALLNAMDAKLTRMIRHDDNPVAVKHELNRTGKLGDEQTVNILVHERRYVQIIGLNARFFKAYKATRDLNAQTGIWQTDASDPLQAQDMATEVIHFIVDRDVLTPYGVPRWINQMPSVMGSRKAEELNVEFFNHGGIPPAIIMIQGGTLSANSRNTLTNYLSGQAKYKQRGVILEIAPSGGDLNSAAQVKVTTEKFGDTEGDSKFEKYDDKCTQRVRSSFRLPAVLIGLEESYNYATVQTAVMMAEEQVFHPERQLFDEILNGTLMKEIDTEGIYVYESKRMTAKFLDEQIKAMTLAKGTVDGKSFVEALNDIAGLDMKFDQAQDALNKQTAQAGLATAAAGQMGGQNGPAQADTGSGGGGASDVGGGPPQGFGRGNLTKSSTSLDGSSTAIKKEDAAQVRMAVTVSPAGKIRKLDHTLLTELADDMAGYMTGDRNFLQHHVTDMHKLVKSMTPALQRLFAENVAQKIMKATHDPNGIRELVSCASDVMARIAKAGEPKALPKDVRKLYVSRAVTNAGELIAWAKNQGMSTCLPPEAMHVTVCYSKTPFNVRGLWPDKNAINCTGGKRELAEFGPEKDTVVLVFESESLQMDHKMYMQAGASFDFPEYRPHVSLTMKKPKNLAVQKIIPYDGVISLGPEQWDDIHPNHNETLVEKMDPYHDNKGLFASADEAANYKTNLLDAKGNYTSKQVVGIQNLTLYHGTSAELWDSIKKDGITPTKAGTGGDKWLSLHGKLMRAQFSANARPASVYLSPQKAFATQFAKLAQELHPEAKGMLLEIHVPNSEWSKFHTDELASDIAYAMRFEGTIKPEWIVSHSEISASGRKLPRFGKDDKSHTLYAVIMYKEP